MLSDISISTERRFGDESALDFRSLFGGFVDSAAELRSVFGRSMFGRSMFGRSMFGRSFFGPSMFGRSAFSVIRSFLTCSSLLESELESRRRDERLFFLSVASLLVEWLKKEG